MQPANVLAYELAHLSAQSLRRSSQLAGRFWSQPLLRSFGGPVAASLEAASVLTDRSLSAMFSKPGWRIDEVRIGLRDVPVSVRVADARPFGDLVHFEKAGPGGRGAEGQPRILLVAPKSGHYATLLRETVIRLLPEADVYITDWRNAREVPVEAGCFDIEDYVEYLLNWFDMLGRHLHVIGVCQPAPLALVAAARQEKRHKRTTVGSLTLMGGPIDPHAAPTEVTRFADKVSIDTLKHTHVHRVSHAYPGKGRNVYPGAMQLSAFVSMNLDRHAKAFQKQWRDLARGDEAAAARHNQFYDEYLAVMDMTAEFYLSTVERIFKKGEVGADAFALRGEHVSIAEMKDTPLMIVEGGRDDVAAPGQCAAALGIASGLPESLKRHHVEVEAGHYAIFSGSRWRNSVAPKILDFIRSQEPANRS
jgi:poly(3-hydroxybutyrate) depolymerase